MSSLEDFEMKLNQVRILIAVFTAKREGPSRDIALAPPSLRTSSHCRATFLDSGHCTAVA